MLMRHGTCSTSCRQRCTQCTAVALVPCEVGSSVLLLLLAPAIAAVLLLLGGVLVALRPVVTTAATTSPAAVLLLVVAIAAAATRNSISAAVRLAGPYLVIPVCRTAPLMHNVRSAPT